MMQITWNAAMHQKTDSGPYPSMSHPAMKGEMTSNAPAPVKVTVIAKAISCFGNTSRMREYPSAGVT